MYTILFDSLKKPPLYGSSGAPFWDDPHISARMLAAHLDPDFEGASRTFAFIERSARWIRTLVPPEHYPRLLDLGCGPGLYAQRFARAGYQVTGVDVSRRSIGYAREEAWKHSLDILYLCESYLTMELGEQFDLAVLIYCDYGALSTADRRQLMTRIYRHLRPGGKLLLDVFTPVKLQSVREEQRWSLHPDGGFWSEKSYLELRRCCRYPGSVTLEQSVVVTGETVNSYCIWHTYFTREEFCREAVEAGFRVAEVFGDIAGARWENTSPTMAILLEK